MNEPETVEKIIMSSGNNFHCKVLNYLKKKDWTVLISPYYNDNISDKPREIDLIAEKAFEVTEWHGNHKGTINVKLFIECKYIPQTIVFWFHDKDKIQAEDLVIRNFNMDKNHSYTQQHHYLSSHKNVAKLFASESKKREENEIIYKALNQSLNAMVYFREGSSIIPEATQGVINILDAVNYPIIICNSFSNFI